jgi:hypothetical protein
VSEDEVVQFLEILIEKYPSVAVKVFANELEKAEHEQQNMQSINSGAEAAAAVAAEADGNTRSFSRERRRLSVFKNIYQQCRIHKRKDKDMCMYLANLYQNVKGFHGL